MRPAAFVLDLGIPEMDAFYILAILQKDGLRPLCPTLLIGKRLGIEEIKRAATLGVRTCMVKPFSGADLLERVAKMLKPACPAPVAVAPPAPASAEFFI
jgi:DNA-binding response OmpR family regulator